MLHYIYCIMDYFENIGDLGKNKNLLNMEYIRKEMWKIRLYDGLFRSSDNILRNILMTLILMIFMKQLIMMILI